MRIGSSEGVHCFYQNSNNDKQVVSGFSTKFEPCFARTFLPGWDEPRIRSTFNVSIQHFSDVVVLTNTAPIKDKIAKNVESPKQSNSMMEKITRTIVISQFEPTPAMPLYLLSFAMGPFVPIELHNIMNFPLKIWSFPFDTFNLQFAANFSPIMFDRIQKDFGVKYPLTKMDFFVTPNFPVGGMENWGLVIFHSSAIKVAQQSEPSLEALSKTTTALKNESNAEHSETTNHDKRKPQKQRQHSILTMIDHLSEQYRVEKVITHEIVHQWFGNLVTMRDWSELWLNEGFASYFVFDHLNVNHPYLTEHEYYLKLIELTEKQTTSGNQGLPLIHSPKHSIELYKMFDGVNLYTKGAVIVKMIKDLIGSTEFRKGMTKYLIRNAYKSVDSQALWNSLPALCDHGTGEQPTLEDALNPWLFNSGMPELIISRSQNDQSIRILQRRSDQNRYIVYLQDDYKLDNGADENSSVVNQQMKRPNRSYQKRRVKSQSKNYWHKNDFFEESHPIKRYQNRNRHKKRARNSYKSATPKTTVFTERETTKNNDIFYEESQKRSNEYYYNEFKSENSKVFPFGPIFDADQSMYSNSSNALQSRKFRASDEHSKNDEPKAPLWSIPFAYSFVSVKNLGGRVLRQFWLRNETTRFVDNEMERTDFMLANPHWINYDLNNWILLIKQLQKNHNYLPVMSRIQLIFDAEMYLKQSAIPSVYVNLLSYLKHETDLGVLLVGLDSIHRLLKMFVATELIGPLLMHLVPAIRQIDKQLSFDDNDKDMPQDPELLAIWLLNPLRLTKLYQLRCLANLDSCDENIQVKKWLKHPTALDAENHRQIIAICSHFFTRATDKEIAVLARLIEQYQYRLMDTTSSDADFDATSGKLIAIIQQLAINCVRDEALLQKVVDEIIKTRNAVIYSSILDSVYSIQYNRKFRELFWKRLSQKLNLHERELLFAVNTGHSDWMARLLLHSIRSLGELNLVEKIVLPKWPERLRVHITYLRRKFKWIENDATRNIQKYLITNSS